jgi:zinc protease
MSTAAVGQLARAARWRRARAALALAVVCSASAVAAPPRPRAAPSSAAPGGLATDFRRSGIADWSVAPPPTAQPAFAPPQPVSMRLRSGLTVVLVENHALPLVAMTLVVPGAGAASDPPDRLGLAALTADLLDEGAGAQSALEIAEQQEQLGAELVPFAGLDSGGVWVRTLRGTLPGTLELLAQLLRRPSFAAADLERVRDDRLTALAQRADRPRDVAGLMLLGALYGARSAHGHPISGYAEDLAACRRADVLRFHQQRWRLDGSTLLVAGDVEPAALRAALERALDGAAPVVATPADAAARPEVPVGAAAAAGPPLRAPGGGPRRRLLVADRPGASQAEVLVGVRGPTRHDPGFYAFEVLRTALGDGFTSRLTQRLREQLGITYGVAANMDWRRGRGPFAITTALETEATGRGVAEILAILRDLERRDLPAAELSRTKQNLIRALPAEFDTNLATTAAFAELVRLGLPLSWYDGFAAQVEQVTARQVRQAAARWLPARAMTVSVVGDLAKIRGALARLRLGPALHHDAAGRRRPR